MFAGTRINPEFVHPGDDQNNFWRRLSDRSLQVETVPFDSLTEKLNLRSQYPTLATRDEPLRVVVFGALGAWFRRSGAFAFQYMSEVFPELKLEIIAVDTQKGCGPEEAAYRACNRDGTYNNLAINSRFDAIGDDTGFKPAKYFTDEEFFRWMSENNEQIDGFYIAVPPEFHFTLLKECLAVQGEKPPFIAVEKPLVVPSDYNEFSNIPIEDRSRIIAMDHFPFSTPASFVSGRQDHGHSSIRDALDLIREATFISAGANETELVDTQRRGLVLRLKGEDSKYGSRLDTGIALDLLTHPQSMIHRLLPHRYRDIHPNTNLCAGKTLQDLRLPDVTHSEFWQYKDSDFRPHSHEETGAMIRYELADNDHTSLKISVQGQKGGPYDSHFLVASSEHGEVLIELGQRGNDRIRARRPMVVIHDAKKSFGTDTIVHTFPVQKKGRYGHPIAEVLNRFATRDGAGNRETLRWQIIAAGLVVCGKNIFNENHEKYIPVVHNTAPENSLKCPIIY